MFKKISLSGLNRLMIQKLLLSVSALGVAAAVSVGGTFGAFTGTTEATPSISTGIVKIALGEAGTAANRLTVAASGLVPGDTIQRAVQLANTGDQALSSIGLTTTASTSSLLNTDVINGLQMVIDRCSQAWTETGTSAPFTYSCAGTVSTIVSSIPVVGSGIDMAGSPTLSPGGTDHLRVTLTLPATASNELQGETSSIKFSFTGTQRTAASK